MSNDTKTKDTKADSKKPATARVDMPSKKAVTNRNGSIARNGKIKPRATSDMGNGTKREDF